MLYEIPSWTLGLVASSYVLPYCIPSIRSAYTQIHTTIKMNTVFTSECIGDIQRKQLDALDRTIGQLISAFCQGVIVLWASLNLLTGGSIESLHNFVIAYYLYDMIYLYLKPYGKTQTLFFFHHSLSIFFIVYIQYTGVPSSGFIHLTYICMELSGCSINITHLFKYSYPTSKNHLVLSAINIVTYGFLRLIVYGTTLTYAIITIEITYIYYIPIFLSYTIFFVSLYWCILMGQKHKKLEQKIIL
jgi:hypothetical protein